MMLWKFAGPSSDCPVELLAVSVPLTSCCNVSRLRLLVDLGTDGIQLTDWGPAFWIQWNRGDTDGRVVTLGGRFASSARN